MPENRSMSIWQQIALLQQWSPVIGYGQQILAEKDTYKKAIIVGDALEWIATTKSVTKLDDEVVKMITSIIESPQGEALIRYIVARVEGGK